MIQVRNIALSSKLKKYFSSNTYSWPRLVCRRTEELFSRPFVDQNEFRFNSDSESYSALEHNRQLVCVSWVIFPHMHPHCCTAHWCPPSPGTVGNLAREIHVDQKCKCFLQFQCQLNVFNSYIKSSAEANAIKFEPFGTAIGSWNSCRIFRRPRIGWEKPPLCLT